MGYQLKSYSKGRKKKYIPTYIFVILYGSWLAYLFLSFYLGDNIVLFEWVPKWTIIIAIAICSGVAGGIWPPFYRPSKYVFGDFYRDCFLGLMLTFPTFNVLVYLSLDQTIHYQTEYEFFSPGPPRIKSGRCEYGIRLKEIYTGQWVSFCISNPKSKTKENTGMVWVTTKMGSIGAYIVDYKFFHPGTKNLSQKRLSYGNFPIFNGGLPLNESEN